MVIKNRNRILLVRGIHKFVLADGGLHGKLSQLNSLLKVCRRCDRTVLVGDRVADTFTKETSVESLRSCWLRRTGGSRDRNECPGISFESYVTISSLIFMICKFTLSTLH